MRWLKISIALVALSLSGCNQSSKNEAVADQGRGIEPIANTSKPPATEALEQASQGKGFSDENAPRASNVTIGIASTYSPIEGSILKDDAINMDVRKTLASEDFDTFITAFEREHANNKDALELSSAYRNSISKSLAAFEGSRDLVRFTCGENVCMGYLRSDDGETWFQDWYRSLAAGKENIPFSTMLADNYALPGGGTEHRLLFSTQGKGGVFMRRP
jgi:hypothetical protein